ncbi:transglycosylase SLT domain-containing protein [Niallia circulans]
MVWKLRRKRLGSKKWAGLATKALMLTNQFTQSNLDRLLYQMQTESGGNPKAINLWDSNAKKGIPSKGLMQVIDPTFRAYAMPGFDKDVYDPLSNILASIRYAVSRYGSLAKAYRGIGYETGGLVNTAGMYQLAEGGWPEYVIPTDPNRRTDAMKLLALAGKQIQGNKRPNQLPNVSASGNSDFQEVIERQDKQIGLMQQQIDLLSKLLLKSNIININDETIEKSVSNLQAKNYGNAAYMMG